MRPEKATILADLQNLIQDTPFLFVVEYTGMTVPHFEELRKRLRESGSQLRVTKNSHFSRAVTNLGLQDLNTILTSQNAIISGQADVCAVAKILSSFISEFDKPSIKGGLLGNVILSAEEISNLAKLPTREILLASLLGTLQAPATQLLRTFNEPGAMLARILQAKIDQEK